MVAAAGSSRRLRMRGAVVAATLLVGAAAAPADPPAVPSGSDTGPEATIAPAEVIYYTWRLEGVVGALAGLFLPSSGEGTLTTRSTTADRLESVLLITSPDSAKGEFWTYGAELRADGRPLRTWSSYLWRGKSRQKESALEEENVVDIASGIHRIRRTLPTRAESMRIWSDGRVYAVEVRPRGEEVRKLPGGPVRTRRFTIEGVETPGERFWKGRLELWLARDPAATPVEILVARDWARVRLERDPRSPLTAGSR